MNRQRIVLLGFGILLGAVLSTFLTERSVGAQATYSQCAFLTIPGASNGADLGGRTPEHPIRVPAGWTPVGGGEFNVRLPGVVVCR